MPLCDIIKDLAPLQKILHKVEEVKNLYLAKDKLHLSEQPVQFSVFKAIEAMFSYLFFFSTSDKDERGRSFLQITIWRPCKIFAFPLIRICL